MLLVSSPLLLAQEAGKIIEPVKEERVEPVVELVKNNWVGGLLGLAVVILLGYSLYSFFKTEKARILEKIKKRGGDPNSEDSEIEMGISNIIDELVSGPSLQTVFKIFLIGFSLTEAITAVTTSQSDPVSSTMIHVGLSMFAAIASIMVGKIFLISQNAIAVVIDTFKEVIVGKKDAKGVRVRKNIGAVFYPVVYSIITFVLFSIVLALTWSIPVITVIMIIHNNGDIPIFYKSVRDMNIEPLFTMKDTSGRTILMGIVHIAMLCIQMLMAYAATIRKKLPKGAIKAPIPGAKDGKPVEKPAEKPEDKIEKKVNDFLGKCYSKAKEKYTKDYPSHTGKVDGKGSNFVLELKKQLIELVTADSSYDLADQEELTIKSLYGKIKEYYKNESDPWK